MLGKIEKVNLSLTIPQVFDDMHSEDASIEMISSSTIKSVKIYFKPNVVNKTKALIFVYKDEQKLFNIGKIEEHAKELLSEKYLGFKKIYIYQSLDKSQYIEKMDLLYSEIEHFEHQKQ